jgi:hypothetical protein
MATIEISSPSSHSQTVDAPGTIVVEADVTNTGGLWGYARIQITEQRFIRYGSIVPIGPGRTEKVSVTYSFSRAYEGDSFQVAGHLYEMTAYGQVIRHIGTPHLDARIYVRERYVSPPYVPPVIVPPVIVPPVIVPPVIVPPYIPPWHWEEEEQDDDRVGGDDEQSEFVSEDEQPTNGNDQPEFASEDEQWGGDIDYEPETDWDASWGDPDDFW